jgi:hypothetical protein
MADPFPWGRTGEADWARWRRDRFIGTEGLSRVELAEAREAARRLGQVADAYAHGYVAGLGLPFGEEQQRYADAAYAFGHEYEQAAWLYAAKRVVGRAGYARAWEDHLRGRGLPLRPSTDRLSDDELRELLRATLAPGPHRAERIEAAIKQRNENES